MLRNACILHGKCNRGGKAMVWFMNDRIDGWMVEKVMNVIKKDFTDDHAGGDVLNGLCRAW